ncbi:MAG: cysteine desulfurase [Aquiluna sp.]|nr:cysteine desulfurase [Aquiluna sp.]
MKVFLDHASTTPVRQASRDALIAALAEVGNPQSVHGHGQRTRAQLEDARDELALALDCNRSEVIFNSGGTEANNQAIKGIYWARNQTAKRPIIISSAIEHHALIDPIEWLCKHEGAELRLVKLLPSGEIDLVHLQELVTQLGDQIALISLMWVNNEVGIITEIEAVTKIAGDIPVHSDAVQAFGHLPISFKRSGLAAMSISGHKIGAPIGVGALIVSRNLKPESLLHGGGQERGLRSGTMSYPLAKSLAAAARDAVADLELRQARLKAFRDHFEAELLRAIPDARVSASLKNRIEHSSNVILPGTKSDSMLFLLDEQGLSVSAGSACQAGVLGPSHVLMGMGYSEADATACLRVSFGHTSQPEDVDFAIMAITKAHAKAIKAQALAART